MNKLKYASSPYLLQHADNPVHWMEWGDEAFALAKKTNKPLIISIGYAACHWCHVMEHESFSNEEVADYMNENFICIKVDREERPDVDRIYMDAAQMINGQGGWPLNAFALPDGKPFFAGTYFPKQRWMEVLAKITDLYVNDNQKVVDYANQLTKGISSHGLDVEAESNSSLSTYDYEQLFESFNKDIDYREGGFNRAPKFPLPVAWEFLLQHYYLTNNQKSLNAVELTLDQMAKGGIYDQIGGGFARYSVDEIWKVPHFEKMLYDNAQLISLYSNTYKISKSPRYKEIVEQSFDFVMRELSDENGGFYSSLNADSEGKEGKFYVWTYDEVKQTIDEKHFNLIAKYYQISQHGNWEDGTNILMAVSSKAEFAKDHNLSVDEFNNILSKADEKLLVKRADRIRPSTDNKILTAWNALMLSACLDAFSAFGHEKYLTAAKNNARFIQNNMIKENASLFRNYMNNKASINAFLDDYSLLAEALIKLYEITFDKQWLDLSKQITDFAIEHFYDTSISMFYYTGNNSENLIARTIETTDNVIPASNSVMAMVLFKLGHFYENEDYINISKSMLAQIVNKIPQAGPWYAKWASLQGLMTFGLNEVAITGNNANELNLKLQKNYLPNSIFIGGHKENLPLLKNRIIDGKSMIYVCKNKTCKLPVENVEDALKQIN